MPEFSRQGDALSRYWAGQVVECRVVADQPGGYQVAVGPQKIAGFLQTERLLAGGDTVLAQFIESREQTAILQELQQSRSTYARLREVLHADSGLAHKFKRATDLMVVPLAGEPRKYSSNNTNIPELLREVAESQLTGCIKSFNELVTSRGAALLHLGRVTGCIYGNKQLSEAHPTAKSLQLMLAEAPLPDTTIWVYQLPEEVSVALSALFLGTSVERTDDLSPVEYAEYMYHWLQKNRQTACFAITAPEATWLTLVFQGAMIGTFCIEEQKFHSDIPYIFGKLRSNPTSRVEMALLSPEMVMPGSDFGFSLLNSH